MTVKATITADVKGKPVDVLVAMVNAKVFSTGSRGYHDQGKLEIDGKRYQYSIQLIEIGSKPKA